MTRSHFSFRATGAALAASLVALALLAPASPATALGSRSVTMELLATTSTGADGSLVVDSGTHRAFQLDKSSKSVKVFDISGSSVAPITSIATKLTSPISMTIDPKSHRLVVGDLTPSAVLIDVDPDSPNANSVLKTIATGGGFPYHLALDGDTVFAGDFNSTDNLSRINSLDGTMIKYDFGGVSKNVVVNPDTHIAYVALPKQNGYPDDRIAVIDSSGIATIHKVSAIPRQIIWVDGGLIAASATGLVKYDPESWAVTASSPSIGVITAGGIGFDRSLGTLFVIADGEMKLLDPTTLSLEGTIQTPMLAGGLALDDSIHRVLLSGDSVEMWSAEPSVQRVSGEDRYEVSAAISRGSAAVPAPVVYVASGAVFSDALSASAAAGANGGVVLLVQKDRIPAAIDAELRRLQPAKIVVLGGTATIDSSVETALAAYAPSVKRIGGADRFEVSAAVSSDAFGTGRPVAYVAAGSTFPDALSGSAAAGRLGGPVLLTAKDAIPGTVDAELRRLAPAKIVVLGGPDSISPAVVSALASIQSNTVRVAGADRFEVSAAVSAAAFPAKTPTVYVASGLVYPDALSGSAAAIAKGSPVLLVTPDNIPAAVATELTRLKPNRIIVLGGPNSVSLAVETALMSYISTN